MKPVTKTTYQCDHCHKSHPTPEAAIECEAKCAEDKEAKRVNNILSKFFKSKRDKYEIRCGGCDKVIIKYEVDCSDPHRNERGKASYTEPHGNLFGADYCIDCFQKKRTFLADAIEEHQERVRNAGTS